MARTIRLWALALAATAAAACGGDFQGAGQDPSDEVTDGGDPRANADPGDDAGERAGTSTQPLIGGTAGTKTGLVARFEFTHNGANCSGVLVPKSGASTASWYITAAHCIDSEPYAHTEGLVAPQSGPSVGVDGIYPHPQGEWGLTGFDLGDGDPDGTGRVDMILVHLATPVPVPAADRNVFFSTDNATIDVYEESFKKDGAFGYSWSSGTISPSSKWPTRANSTISTEPGDSGGPLWGKSSIDRGGRLYQGLLSSGNAGGVTDASSFQAWAIDGINCGVFDISHPSATFCSASCPCGVGEGDCDSSAECKPGLTCQSNAGPKVGLPSSYDICLEPRREAWDTEATASLSAAARYSKATATATLDVRITWCAARTSVRRSVSTHPWTSAI